MQSLTLRQFAAVKVMQWAGLTQKQAGTLSPVDSRSGWWPWRGLESFIGAWQRNTEIVLTDVLTDAVVYACITMIASDIAKLRIKLVRQDGDGIWEETESPSFSPVLKKPNRYQTRIRFLENWITSKLIWGNTYVLKQRDDRGVVVALYVLDPQRVQVLVAPDGSVYYELKRDDLSGQPRERIVAPASEIIHDINVALYHPLVGISPISACGLAAMQRLRMQDNSAVFFENGSQPGGLLSAPGAIPQLVADRLKAYWDTNFSGANRGKVAVVGDGLTYTPLSFINAKDSDLIQQLKWTAENICQAFHMPPYKIGIGDAPPYGNYAAVKQDYHETCLQIHIESIELLLDEGLGLTTSERKYGTELDLDNLLRMDAPSRVKTAAEAIGSGGMAPDEARKRYLDLGRVPGGRSPYLQQQYYSLEALSERDQDKPFAKPAPATPATPATTPSEPSPSSDEEKQIRRALLYTKAQQRLRAA